MPRPVEIPESYAVVRSRLTRLEQAVGRDGRLSDAVREKTLALVRELEGILLEIDNLHATKVGNGGGKKGKAAA